MPKINDDDAIAELEKQVTDLTKQLGEALEAQKTAKAAGASELEKQIKELTDKLTKAEAANVALKADSEMTEEERTYCKDMDPEAKAKFLAMSPADRKKEMEKKASSDEVVKVGNREIRKSVIGADQFAVIKTQQEELAKNRADLAEERSAREMANLEKRADAEFKHVQGSSRERGEMLKAIAAMDEPLRKSFEAVFAQSEKLAKSLFERVGHSGGQDDLEKGTKGSIDAFEKKVDEVAAANKGLSRSQAMSKARSQYPKEFEAYQKAGSN